MASKEEIQIILDAQLKNSQKTIEAVKKLEKNIKGADKSIKQAEKSTKFFSTTLGKIAGAVGLGYAINSVKNFTASIIKSRGEMEQYEIAFEVMLGSAEKAGKLLEEITEFAEKTPFELNGLVKSSKELLAFGVEADKVIPTLETLGNIASGTGVDISRLTFVFGQVKTAGKLFAQDLNQFTQAGVPLISALAKEMNIAEEEVKQFGSEGKIAFEDVERALKTLGNTKFANLMARQNNTVLGQFSNLQDVVGKFTRSLGKPLEGVVKKTTQSLIGFFERLIKTVEEIEENEDAIREWAEGFMEGVLTVFDVLKRFGSYAVDFFSNNFVQAVGVALVSWKAFSSAMTLSLKGITKALALVGGAIAYINSKIESGIDKTFKSVSDTAKSLKGTYDQLKNSFGGALGFNVENKTTTTTAEVSTKTTKEQKKKTGQDEKAREKKLKDDLLAIDKDYNTKKLNQQAKSVEKQNELNQLASWGYYDEAEKKIEAKELELSSLKEANDLELAQQKEKLDLLREIKGEDNELVLEQEAEFRLMKAEQQAEFDEQQDELKQARENLIKQQELQKQKEEQKLLKEKQLSIKLFENEKFKMVESGLSQIVALTNSKNKELNRIGQAAAIAQIGISTAKGAVEAFNSAAFLPAPANIIVGGAMAGTVIAYGAEQISNVARNSFAVGSPNIEQDQLANIHKGEIIVPKTFSDGLRDGDLMLGNAKSLDNQQTDEQRGGITIVNNFEGANFYGVADKDEMIKEVSEAISENIADGLIQPFPTEQI
jgi:tape measure domain-containing protein